MAQRLYLSIGDETFTAEVAGNVVQIGETKVAIEQNGGLTAVHSAWHLRPRGSAVTSGDDVWVTVDGEVFVIEVRRSARANRRGARDHAAFTSPMPATVVRIAVTAGATVQAGDVLIALEAMKM
jgi:acetyl-CoA/propionyl-CoA carboxylase biotin carboxyl carrier protein